ncbi:DUF1573 domain-containing protein [Pseudodesulfovibrio sp.]|uniref:DUF1573 domain-containing protein n=1 Tax=Pseudodesulfovibrio sp. TaxID=2035812 RepID=UPI00262CB8A1|nr:DUF1573 domain-containing protein [Pseudodesulfovibrio sp.]MDD3311766.1 DUF1573 domain-containing protein [Pseudodesulfovibrio sp.]
MKLRIIVPVCALALCLAGAAFAGQLKISDTQVMFGNMKEGPDAQKTITLTNVSGERAVVANVSTSCACTTTRMDRTELAPGQTATMVITYHTFKYPGKFDKTVHVFTGPDGKTEDVIHILGYVDPIPMGVMEVEPRKVDVGVLAAGKANPVSVQVRNAGDAPLKVTAVKSQKTGATYWSGDLTVAPGQSAPLGFSVAPASAGRFLDVVMIHSDARNDIGKGYKAVLLGKVE